MQLPSNIAAFSLWRYALAGLIIIALAAYFFLGRAADLGATLTISQGDFREQVSVSGTVIATRDVDLGFAANGRIAGTYAKVGQQVAAGVILAETENGDLAATLIQKQAELTQAQANLASLQAGTRPEEIAIASTSVANALSTLVNAVQSAYTSSDDAIHNKADAFFTNPRTDPKLSFTVTNTTLRSVVERDRVLIEATLADWALLVTKLSNNNIADLAKQTQAYLAHVTTLLADANAALNQSVPDQATSAAALSSYGTTLATARTNVNTAATTLTTSVAALYAAQSTLALKHAGSTSETIAAQEAAVAAAAADVHAAKAKLAATRVIAPFSGTVTRMDAKIGEIIAPAGSKISMQSDGVFEIETYIPEVNIARITRGNPAITTLDAYGSSVAFPATVIMVDPAETLKDGVPTYKTTLAFLNDDPRIRSGMTANVIITTGTLHNTIIVPAGAIGTKEGVHYVSVVKNDTAVSRTVVTGPSPALGQAEILSGLTAGEIILLAPVP